jgi:hypothetical protein
MRLPCFHLSRAGEPVLAAWDAGILWLLGCVKLAALLLLGSKFAIMS